MVDFVNRDVQVRGQRIHLTSTEYAQLALLARYPGRVLTHSYLLRNVWGPAYEKEVRYLRVYMARLRDKIEEDAACPKLSFDRARRRIPVAGRINVAIQRASDSVLAACLSEDCGLKARDWAIAVTVGGVSTGLVQTSYEDRKQMEPWHREGG